MNVPSFHLFSLPLFQDGLLLLAEKIQGPFSFELAAQSIGAKISEGLMHLQENSVGVSAQVQGPGEGRGLEGGQERDESGESGVSGRHRRVSG